MSTVLVPPPTILSAIPSAPPAARTVGGRSHVWPPLSGSRESAPKPGRSRPHASWRLPPGPCGVSACQASPLQGCAPGGRWFRTGEPEARVVSSWGRDPWSRSQAWALGRLSPGSSRRAAPPGSAPRSRPRPQEKPLGGGSGARREEINKWAGSGEFRSWTENATTNLDFLFSLTYNFG